MREIQAQQITDVVEKLCIEANQYLPGDVTGGNPPVPCMRGLGNCPGSAVDKIITNFGDCGK